MSTPTSILLLLLLACFYSNTSAFPHFLRGARSADVLGGIVDGVDLTLATTRFITTVLTPSVCPFQVDHEKFPYRAPGPGDKRGPCPGLNALANHGYLPRNGITNTRQLMDASTCIMSFDYPLTASLLVLSMFTVGDLQNDRLSLGMPELKDGSLTKNLGLCWHTGIRLDASMSRTDTHLAQQPYNCSLNGTLWNQMKNLAADNWSGDFFSKLRYLRWQQSKAENEIFYFGPQECTVAAATALIALRRFRDPGQEPTTLTQESFFVQERIPITFQYIPEKLGFPEIATFLLKIIADNVAPTFCGHILPPTRPECFLCWLRVALEETAPGSNLLQAWYATVFTPYATCTLQGCGYNSTATTPSPVK